MEIQSIGINSQVESQEFEIIQSHKEYTDQLWTIVKRIEETHPDLKGAVMQIRIDNKGHKGLGMSAGEKGSLIVAPVVLEMYKLLEQTPVEEDRILTREERQKAESIWKRFVPNSLEERSLCADPTELDGPSEALLACLFCERYPAHTLSSLSPGKISKNTFCTSNELFTRTRAAYLTHNLYPNREALDGTILHEIGHTLEGHPEQKTYLEKVKRFLAEQPEFSKKYPWLDSAVVTNQLPKISCVGVLLPIFVAIGGLYLEANLVSRLAVSILGGLFSYYLVETYVSTKYNVQNDEWDEVIGAVRTWEEATADLAVIAHGSDEEIRSYRRFLEHAYVQFVFAAMWKYYELKNPPKASLWKAVLKPIDYADRLAQRIVYRWVNRRSAELKKMDTFDAFYANLWAKTKHIEGFYRLKVWDENVKKFRPELSTIDAP